VKAESIAAPSVKEIAYTYRKGQELSLWDTVAALGPFHFLKRKFQ
jgi:hypothetical protein